MEPLLDRHRRLGRLLAAALANGRRAMRDGDVPLLGFVGLSPRWDTWTPKDELRPLTDETRH